MARKFIKYEKEYDKIKIVETLNKLSIEQIGEYIVTKFDGRTISDAKVSKIYQIFDFASFSFQIMNEIEKYFAPEKYSLNIYQGTQELRLLGEIVNIAGNNYRKMFTILNSTDRSKALTLNIGLFKLSSNTPLVIGERSFMYNKHYKSTLPEKVAKFVKKLKDFDVILSEQIGTIEKLHTQYVDFQKVAQNMLIKINDDGVEEIKPTIKLKFGSLCKRYLMFHSDNLSVEQKKILRDPISILKTEVKIILPAINVFECYSELFNEEDSSVVRRENTRILTSMFMA
jgi:hypothetical protein